MVGKPLEETHTLVFHEAEIFRAHVGLMGDDDDDDDDDDDGTDDGTGPENAIQMLYNGNDGNENDHNDEEKVEDSRIVDATEVWPQSPSPTPCRVSPVSNCPLI